MLLIPLAGRRVEAMHAEVKRLGAVAKNVQPPWISAAVSESLNLERLRAEPWFSELCLRRWRYSKLLDDVLLLVAPEDNLRDMSRTHKIQKVYHCSVD